MPAFLNPYFGLTWGSLASYATSLSLLFFFFFTKEKHKPLWAFILLGILYFTISSFNYSDGLAIDLIKEFIRFMIVPICAIELLYRTTKKEIYIILLVGSLSIIINATIFPTGYGGYNTILGRYSGFYMNPNYAGYICLIGFALSYSITSKWLRIIGQLVFTLAGILTLSRGFIVIWLIVNMLSIYNNRKNVVVPMLGVFVLLVVFALSSMLSLNQERFSALQSIFDSDTQVQTKTITDDSRTATWALYSDIIADNPIFGNGYGKMRDRGSILPGIHNSYLMVLGEAGIIPFLLMIGIYIHLLIRSIRDFRKKPENFYLSCVLVLSLMVAHGFFMNFYTVLITMYVFVEFRKDNLDSSLIAEA